MRAPVSNYFLNGTPARSREVFDEQVNNIPSDRQPLRRAGGREDWGLGANFLIDSTEINFA
jgi:hypothetical protein